jgi:hypothetical protein
LDENQALALDKEDVLAHWRCDHEALATKKQKRDELLILAQKAWVHK